MPCEENNEQYEINKKPYDGYGYSKQIEREQMIGDRYGRHDDIEDKAEDDEAQNCIEIPERNWPSLVFFSHIAVLRARIQKRYAAQKGSFLGCKVITQ